MKSILCLITVLCAAPRAFALSEGLLIDDLVAADLIVRVTIVSIADAPKDSGYTKLAQATVTDVARGSKVGATIQLLSEQSVLYCPHIVYSVGDDCIVVAKRHSTGHFETSNFTAGRFIIKDNKLSIHPFYRSSTMSHGSDGDFRTDQQYGDFRGKTPVDVMAGLRRLLILPAFANAGLKRAATPPETKPESEPAEHSADADTKSNWTVAGEWRVTHPNWKGTLIIRADGTFLRPHGDGGKWSLTADGDHLVLQLVWKSWVTETAAMITPDLFTGKVRKGEFQLRRGEQRASDEPATPPEAAPAKEFNDPALKEQLNESTWQLHDGKHFTFHADGSTTGDWHDRKGFWRIVGRNRVQLTIMWRELPPATVTVSRDATVLRWSDEDWGQIAKRVEINPDKP